MEETNYLGDQADLLKEYLHLPVLDKLEGDYAAKLLSLSRLRSYQHGEIITNQRDFDPWVYILLRGSANVIVEGEVIAELNTQGEIFGEMVLIDESERSATLVATQEVQCLAIDAVLIYEMSQVDQDAFFSIFFRLVSAVLAKRLRETNEELALLRKEYKLF